MELDTKKLYVQELPVSIHNEEIGDLFQEIISDLPYLAFHACKTCKKQAGIAAMKFFTVMIESTVDMMLVGLGVAHYAKISGGGQQKLPYLHPIAPKLALLTEHCDYLKEKNTELVRVAWLEHQLVSLKKTLIVRSEDSIEHDWDSETVKALIAECQFGGSSTTH